MDRPRKQEQEPAATGVTEVGPGVLRLQLPISLPGLGHVNAYALLDDRGAAIVDTGVPGPATWRALKRRLRDAGLRVKDVHTVVVTHSHPDHFGTAGKLAQASGADVVVHSAFRTFWNRQPCDHGGEIHDVDEGELPTENPWRGKTTPWGGSGFAPPLRRRLAWTLMRQQWTRLYVPVQPTRRVRHGEALKLAGREWFAVHTPGHTLDHLCLHDPEAGLLLSGDHVLPTITPHISGVGTGRDPLAHFFASLDRVAELPGVRQVLPAHGHPFADVRARTEDIKEHHRGRLERLRQASVALGPSSVADLSHQLFRPERWGPMAESETFAHLEHLRLAGEAERSERDGVLFYDVAPPPAA